MLPFAVAVVLEARSMGRLETDLATAAGASARPRVCRLDSATATGRDDAGLWRRLQRGEDRRYCELLARGYARLAEAPAEALAAADAARALARTAPAADALAAELLGARARLRLGEAARAYAELSEVEGRDARSFLDARALHDYARAASLSGNDGAALRLYRMLASRVALLADARESVVAYLEAAAHVLALAPGGKDEALGYLTEARRAPLGLSTWVEALRRVANGQRLSTASTGRLRLSSDDKNASDAILVLPESLGLTWPGSRADAGRRQGPP